MTSFFQRLLALGGGSGGQAPGSRSGSPGPGAASGGDSGLAATELVDVRFE